MNKYLGTVYACVGRPGEDDMYCYDFIPGLRFKRYQSRKEIVDTWKKLAGRIIDYYALTRKEEVDVEFSKKSLTSKFGDYTCIDCVFFTKTSKKYIGYCTMHIHK